MSVTTLKETSSEHTQKNNINDIVAKLPGMIYQYIIDTNGDTKFKYLSESVLEIWGIDVSEAYRSGAAIFNNIHPEDRDRYLSAVERSNRDGTNISFPFRVITPSGKMRWLQASSSPSYLTDGSIIRTGILIDITESKLLYEDATASVDDVKNIFQDLDTRNQQLARSKANLLEILDTLPVGVFIKTPSEKFIYANKFYCSIWGFDSLHELQQADIFQLQAKVPDWNCISESDSVVISSRQSVNFNDIAVRAKDGNTRFFDVTKCLFQLTEGKEEEILGIIFETTGFKTAETERRKYIADLSERNAKLERFSQIVSHQLRAPVATIMSVTNWMANNLDAENDNSRILLEGLADATRKIDNVIRDLNDALSAANEQPISIIKFTELIDDLRIPLNKEAGPDGVDIISDFSEATEIHTIPKYLYNLFYHILSASVRQKRKNTKITIGIKSERTPEGITVTVRDNGAGIDMNTYGNLAMELYEMYYSRSSENTYETHARKKQANLLRAVADINSSPGKGTAITLLLNDLR
jgi:PAS domain S-box-containing protein